MGLVTEFFLATTSEFDNAFITWARPLETPRESEEVDPASGAVRVVRSWAPRPSATELEPHKRGPRPDLAGLPRFHLRGISPAELLTLRAALVGDAAALADDEILRPARVAPPGHNQWVHRLPDRLVEQLAAMDAGELVALGKAWGEAELRRLDSIEDDAVRAARVKHHRPEFWAETASELQTLAVTAQTTQAGLYLYMYL